MWHGHCTFSMVHYSTCHHLPLLGSHHTYRHTTVKSCLSNLCCLISTRIRLQANGHVLTHRTISVNSVIWGASTCPWLLVLTVVINCWQVSHNSHRWSIPGYWLASLTLDTKLQCHKKWRQQQWSALIMIDDQHCDEDQDSTWDTMWEEYSHKKCHNESIP